MSQSSLAAARKRRAPTSTVNNVNPALPASSPVVGTRSSVSPAVSQMNPNQGLTLPQVISLVDKRLCILETHMKENVEQRFVEQPLLGGQRETDALVPSNLTEILDEFNERFETLAEELTNLKNIVLNLQSYTMDVNKVLLQERIRILGEDGGENITVEEQDVSSALSVGANL